MVDVYFVRARSFNVCAIVNFELCVSTTIYLILHSAYIVRATVKMSVTVAIRGRGIKNFTCTYVRVTIQLAHITKPCYGPALDPVQPFSKRE